MKVKGDIYATYSFQEFLAKVFAITSFRLPKVSPIIQAAIQFTEEQTLELDHFLSDKKYQLPLRNPFDSPVVSRPTSPNSSTSSPKSVPASPSNLKQLVQTQEVEKNENNANSSSNPTQTITISPLPDKDVPSSDGNTNIEESSQQDTPESPVPSDSDSGKDESSAPGLSPDSTSSQDPVPSENQSLLVEESESVHQNKEEPAAPEAQPEEVKEPAVKDVSIPAPISSPPPSPSAKRLLFMADKFPNLFKWSNVRSFSFLSSFFLQSLPSSPFPYLNLLLIPSSFLSPYYYYNSLSTRSIFPFPFLFFSATPIFVFFSSSLSPPSISCPHSRYLLSIPFPLPQSPTPIVDTTFQYLSLSLHLLPLFFIPSFNPPSSAPSPPF